MFMGIVRYQADVIGGDANASTYRYYKKQRYASVFHSNLHTMARRLVRAVNRRGGSDHSYWGLCSIGMDYITSHTIDQLEKLDAYFANSDRRYEDHPNTGCIVAVVYSWKDDIYSKKKMNDLYHMEDGHEKGVMTSFDES